MRESILERNLTLVRSVGNLSQLRELYPTTVLYILERKLTVVNFVGKLFHSIVTGTDIDLCMCPLIVNNPLQFVNTSVL